MEGIDMKTHSALVVVLSLLSIVGSVMAWPAAVAAKNEVDAGKVTRSQRALATLAGVDIGHDVVGPLTHIVISPDLNCAVNHVADSVGEFFNDTACGTFLVVNGTLYGPN